MQRATPNWIARPGLIRAQLSGEARARAAVEPRGLAAPPARAASPGELIQVASAPGASRHPQVCPFCFWCLHAVDLCPRPASVVTVSEPWGTYACTVRPCRLDCRTAPLRSFRTRSPTNHPGSGDRVFPSDGLVIIPLQISHKIIIYTVHIFRNLT